MENMNKEICDYYVPTNLKSNKMCKYFTGNKDKIGQLEKCRFHCSISESSQCMESRSYVRHKGAVKQR